jgi:hypothetical protein
VKFNFNHDRLVSWAPVYAWKPGGLSQRELVKRIKFPWRAHDQDIVEDSDIPETAHTISTLFGDNDAGRIDGVKGYVTRKGKFCGLLFRRNERWSEGVFGERSAYETPFFLEPDEFFTSIFLPEKGRKRESNALAVCVPFFLITVLMTKSLYQLLTNHGRVTPWFGKIEEGSVARHLDAPLDHVAVGLYGAQFNVSWIASHRLSGRELTGGRNPIRMGVMSSIGSDFCTVPNFRAPQLFHPIWGRRLCLGGTARRYLGRAVITFRMRSPGWTGFAYSPGTRE